jgi:sterol desaturase/sphingolipid hydroxylase (fatty acid hydroxylase superfamily)
MEGSDIAIRKQGKHLDELTTTDKLFIAFNKLCTALFTYHAIRFAWTSPDVRWKLTDATLVNTAVALVLLYVMYDLGYTLFHRLLHHRSLYGAIHKHHHRQMAPTRGNIDAINVHPFEFVTGEYNHLFVLWLVSRWLLRDFGGVHVITAVVFIVAGGVLASLNHTRFDVRLPVPLLSNYYWYQVRSHDVHHWYPPCNYGQYTMLWDKIMGSHRPYPTEDASAAGAVPLSGRWSSDQAKTA